MSFPDPFWEKLKLLRELHLATSPNQGYASSNATPKHLKPPCLSFSPLLTQIMSLKK